MAGIEGWLANAPKFCREKGRPLVTVSYAQSLDGSLAARSGQPLAISGAESMRMTHALRAAHDAILVGIGTLLADDPQLTVRLVEGKQPQPVVLDSKLRTPLTARLLEHPKGLWIAAAQGTSEARQSALRDKGAQILLLPVDETGGVNLAALLQELARRGVCSLMVEGGAGVIGSFLQSGLVEQVIVTIAPRLVGGLHLHMQDQLQGWSSALSEVGFARLGEDLIVFGRPAASPSDLVTKHLLRKETLKRPDRFPQAPL